MPLVVSCVHTLCSAHWPNWGHCMAIVCAIRGWSPHPSVCCRYGAVHPKFIPITMRYLGGARLICASLISGHQHCRPSCCSTWYHRSAANANICHIRGINGDITLTYALARSLLAALHQCVAVTLSADVALSNVHLLMSYCES